MIEDEKLERQIKIIDNTAKKVFEIESEIEVESVILGNKIKAVLKYWLRDANIQIFPLKSSNCRSLVYDQDLKVEVPGDKTVDFDMMELNDKFAIYLEVRNTIIERR